MSSGSSRENSPRLRLYRRPASTGSDDELFDAARSLSSFRTTPRTAQQQRYTSDYSQHTKHPNSYQNAGPPSTSYQQAGSSSTVYPGAGSSSTSYPPPTSHQSARQASVTYQSAPPPPSVSQSAAPPSGAQPPSGLTYNTPTTVAYSSSRPVHPTTQTAQASISHVEPPPDKSSKKKSSSSKGKEKEKDKHKSSSSSSRKHKDRDTGRVQNSYSATTGSGAPPQSQYPVPQPPIPGTQTAFRIDSYVNDPRAGPSPAPLGRGPYSSDFRATPPSGDSAGTSKHRTSTHGAPGQIYGRLTGASSSQSMTAQEESRRSYYRHDYEKQRESTQALRRDATSSVSSGHRDAPTYAHPSSHHSSAPPPSASAYPYPEQHSSAPTPRASYPYPEPSAHYSSSQAHVPPTTYRPSSPPREYERYEPPSFEHEVYRAPSPVPPPSIRHSSPERHHRSHSRRHEHEQYAHSQPQPYLRSSPPPRSAEMYPLRAEPAYAPEPAPPPPSAPQPMHVNSLELGRVPAGARVLRTLTLLIEDQRHVVDGEPVSMLVEVRVPLKQADNPEDGYWADAKEVSDELQAGPSRIDGRAKVYTMRGRFRQYFLRITPEDGLECTSANMKATPERTLELFVEDFPPATMASQVHVQSQSQANPYVYERRPLTPVADSRAVPASLPPPLRMATPPPPQSSHVRHSYHPVVGELPSTTRPYDYESDPPPRKPKKRHRESTTSARSSIHVPPQPETSYSARPPYEHPQPRYGSPSGYESGAHMSSVAPTPPMSRYSPMSHSRSPAPVMSPASAPAVHVMPPSGRFSPSPASPPQFISQHSEYREYNSDTTSLPGPSSPKKARHSRRMEADSPGAADVFSDHRRTTSMQGVVTNLSYPPPLAPVAPPDTAYHASPAPAPPPSTSYPPIPTHAPPPVASYPPAPGPSRPSSTSYPPAVASAPLPSTSYSPAPASGPPPIQPQPPAAAPTPGAARNESQNEQPSATLPSAAGARSGPSEDTTKYSEEVNMAVGMHLRGIFSREPGWDAFVKARNNRIKMSQQLEQYRYVKSKFDEYVGTKAPADLAGAPGVTITQTQVMKAFNLPLTWAEDGIEALTLTGMYGPGGKRLEDPRVGAMLDELPLATTGIQSKKYLDLLRGIHSRWTTRTEHPDA